MFKKILLPVDLGELEMARRAITEAVSLAKASSAELRLITVPALVPVAVEHGPVDAKEKIADLAAKIDYPQERVSTAVRIGSAYHESLTEAADWGADLIVLCSHRPTMSTYLLGSTAAKIVRYAKCSVLVLR